MKSVKSRKPENKLMTTLKKNKFVALLDEFIPLKWIGIFLLIPTIIFIFDINIMETWIVTYYVIFTVLMITGFIRFIQLKKK
jgi:hypothetical protein